MEVEVDALLPLLSVVMVSIMLISVCHFVSVKQPTKYSSLTSFGSPHSLNTNSEHMGFRNPNLTELSIVSHKQNDTWHRTCDRIEIRVKIHIYFSNFFKTLKTIQYHRSMAITS